MKIIEFDPLSLPGYLVQVDHDEALRLIRSLTSQMILPDCREDFCTEDGTYFSIVVQPQKKSDGFVGTQCTK